MMTENSVFQPTEHCSNLELLNEANRMTIALQIGKGFEPQLSTNVLAAEEEGSTSYVI